MSPLEVGLVVALWLLCCLPHSPGLVSDFLHFSPFLFPSQSDLSEFKTGSKLAMLTVCHAVGLTVPRQCSVLVVGRAELYLFCV